ncbi:MAG: hypothetical protein RLZZ245_1098 [Verrucomicrobiota bacterium]
METTPRGACQIFRHGLLALATVAGFSTGTAHAQFADWKASPPKILPNERIGSKAGDVTTGRQVANLHAFAALTADGSIRTWGDPLRGGSGAPTDSGYTTIYSNGFAFAALKADGSLKAWGIPGYGGEGAPTDSGYTEIYSGYQSFVARKADGSITPWGKTWIFLTGPGGRYSGISTALHGTAVLDADGSITAWGANGFGADKVPTDSGYTAIFSTSNALAALKADGSISAWGGSAYGGVGAPTDSGYTTIYSTTQAFVALKADGSITAWGDPAYGGIGAPTDSGYTTIYSATMAFAALKVDGSITAWGNPAYGGIDAPTDSGYTTIAASSLAFAALKADGSITAWGYPFYGGRDAPTDSGYTAIFSSSKAFAALKADGSITTWGDASSGGSGAPTDSGYTAIFSAPNAFAAQKADGSITTWGDAAKGGSGAPTGTGYRIQSVLYPGPHLTPRTDAVTASSAVIGGNLARGSKILSERGVVYAPSSANADPKAGGAGVTQRVEVSPGALGAYSFALSGLSPSTAYSFRAYVKDVEGEIYYSGVGIFFTSLAPEINSNGGGSSATLGITENATAVTTVVASDGDIPAQTLTYSIVGGEDAAQFSINPATGVLVFGTAPDFEIPSDVGKDNRYQVTVQAIDNGNPPKSARQALTIQVSNLAEPGDVNAPTVTGVASSGAALGGTVVHDGGGGGIFERGVVYALTSVNSDPQLGGSGVAKLTAAGKTGTFSRELGGLAANSNYSFRAYAINASGTAYSSVASFTTLVLTSPPDFFYDVPAVLGMSVPVSYAPLHTGSAVADGSYLQVTNFAGSGTAGATDATGTSATFKRPVGLTVDAAGNVYVADNANHKIRKITASGVVTTLAGDGYASVFSFGRLVNGNGAAASFNYPTDIAMDETRECLYIADNENNVIRRISLVSPYAVTTFAGSSSGILDSATGSGAKFNGPEGIAIDPSGTHLYVADRKNNRIRKITIASAAVTTLAGSGTAGATDHASPLSATFNEPTGIAVDAAGNLYVTDYVGNKVRKITMTAGVAGAVTTLGGSATFSAPYGVDVDGAGHVYVTEHASHLIRMISPAGTVTTLAGVSGVAGSAEGIGTAATFNQPSGISIHPDGVAYLTHYANAATGHKIRKMNLTGYKLTGTLPAGLTFNATSGVISGVPTGTKASLTVTAWNYYGIATTALTVSIGIDPVFSAPDQTLRAADGFAADNREFGNLVVGFIPAPGLILTVVNNTGSSPVSGMFSGLPEGSWVSTIAGGDTFWFRLSYTGGTGNDITLTRIGNPQQMVYSSSGPYTPFVYTNPATGLSATTATLNGFVNPNGFITAARFEYGMTTSYGSSAAVTLSNPAVGYSNTVSADLTGLSPGGTYHYRLTATNVDGTSQTADGTFSTVSPLAAPTLAADPISAHLTASSATLGGEVTADGGAAITERGVVYAATATNPAPEIGGTGVTKLSTTGSTGTFYLEVGSLTASTAYGFRAYAINSFGTTYSSVGGFTTGGGVARSHQQEWRFANFGAYDSENSGADAADPDGDGLSNLLEYALGLDPNTAGVMPAVLVLNGANLEYTYSRDTAARENGINYQIEWSDTLDVGSWSTETVTEEILSTEAALETVKTSVPAGSGGKRFLRLRVN